MAANPSIQELTITVGVDMRSIRDQVGPLVLSTTRPYRERRNSQPRIIARHINMGQKEAGADYSNRGALGNFPAEILSMIFERMSVQTFVRMRRVSKSVKVCIHHKIHSIISLLIES